MKKLDAMLQARLKFNAKEPLNTSTTTPLPKTPLIRPVPLAEDDLPPPPLPKTLPPETDLPDDLPPPPPQFEEEQEYSHRPPQRFTQRINPPPKSPNSDKENNNNTLNTKPSRIHGTTRPTVHATDDAAIPICCVCDTKIVR